MNLLVINGPNLNLLGIREPNIYGDESFAALERFIQAAARESGASVELFQSNHERLWIKFNLPMAEWTVS